MCPRRTRRTSVLAEARRTVGTADPNGPALEDPRMVPPGASRGSGAPPLGQTPERTKDKRRKLHDYSAYSTYLRYNDGTTRSQKARDIKVRTAPRAIPQIAFPVL